uniref:methyl-accepting chemotaxis protein n=1 Tax=Aliarcobacter sp. TaxID=2321116 RepID=UPI004048E5A1
MGSLKSKLLLLAIVPFIIGISILSCVSYFKTDMLLKDTLTKFENSIVKEKQSLLKNQLMATKSLIGTILEKEKNLSLAKEQIISLLSGIRYLEDKSGYFFAYEQREDGYYFGFHPTKPDLNNKKTDITKPDVKGFAFRQDLIKYAKEEKYVIYHYERPKTKEIVPKMASSIYISELNWTLVTGIYVDDIEKQMSVLEKELNKETNIALFITIISTLVLIILCIVIVLPLVNSILLKPINKFQEGLNSFFKYLNKEASTVELIESKSKDELGQMSRILNDNIKKAQKDIEEDRKIINDTVAVLGEFEKGDLSQRLNTNVTNPAFIQLKSVLNKMAANLEKNIDNVLSILEQYSKYNYLNKVETNGLTQHLLKLANGVNDLSSSITNMLIEGKSNGSTLGKSSTILLSNVQKLNESSTEAASSLEETAAALEQITSNIRNNTQNIAKMSNLANNVTSSANSGEKLANQTVSSMEEINSQVTSINEAITVIDQIAFQTNILSLNAAVEAATAGEAGRGFAVVAAEVRNLANRSAEAAREIKNIVENATNKANEGKLIANDMINGYDKLNENILHTIELIKNIENSSKEQLSGIEQINYAVVSLDQQTQENATIASQTREIALSTDKIAKTIINNVNNKEFIGK